MPRALGGRAVSYDRGTPVCRTDDFINNDTTQDPIASTPSPLLGLDPLTPFSIASTPSPLTFISLCRTDDFINNDITQDPTLPRTRNVQCAKVRFFFFFTLGTGPRRSLSLKLSDTRVYEPQIRGAFRV